MYGVQEVNEVMSVLMRLAIDRFVLPKNGYSSLGKLG